LIASSTPCRKITWTWRDHGPLGAPGAAAGPGRTDDPEKLTAIVPMPEAKVMLDILQLLA